MATLHEFDVPFGYEDPSGTVHNHIVMRRVRNEDLIRIGNDARVKALKTQGHKISAGALRLAENMKAGIAAGSASDFEGDVDPIALQLTEAAMLELNGILFSLVCTRVGDITEVDRSVFAKMHPADMEVIQQEYEKFNSPPASKEASPNSAGDPTGDSAS